MAFRERRGDGRLGDVANERQKNRHSILEPGNMLVLQERERLLWRVLRRRGLQDFAALRVFEAGCAGGYNLRQAVQWGARPGNVAGIDLNEASIEYCQTRAPAIRVHCGSAADIPEEGETFDLTLAFTLFSSVPEEGVAAAIAAELVRITRPGGLILVYDMRRGNPRNPAVHRVSGGDIERWFAGCEHRHHSLTLLPPAARMVGRYAPFAYGPLARLPFLRSHELHELTRPAVT